jgi:hypothetical protein
MAGVTIGMPATYVMDRHQGADPTTFTAMEAHTAITAGMGDAVIEEAGLTMATARIPVTFTSIGTCMMPMDILDTGMMALFTADQATRVTVCFGVRWRER